MACIKSLQRCKLQSLSMQLLCRGNTRKMPVKTKKYTKGQKIVYCLEQEPVEGEPILASFGDSCCHTPCKHFPDIKVGSLSCSRCEFYGGREAFAISTGNESLFGGASEHRNIYCKKT